MLIALDYDGTYTADPVFWETFIVSARVHGHTVVCITMRHEHEEMARALRFWGIWRHTASKSCLPDGSPSALSPQPRAFPPMYGLTTNRIGFAKTLTTEFPRRNWDPLSAGAFIDAIIQP